MKVTVRSLTQSTLAPFSQSTDNTEWGKRKKPLSQGSRSQSQVKIQKSSICTVMLPY